MNTNKWIKLKSTQNQSYILLMCLLLKIGKVSLLQMFDNYYPSSLIRSFIPANNNTIKSLRTNDPFYSILI